MKNIRYISIVCLGWLLAFAASAQTNVLRVPAVSYPAGRTLSLPVELENSSDIVAAQFEIQLPYRLNRDADGQWCARLKSARGDGHSVSLREVSTVFQSVSGVGSVRYYKYLVLILSERNARLQGTGGTLLTFDIDLPQSLAVGSVLPVYLTAGSVILSDREGRNVATGEQNGSVSITDVAHPDLLPTDVSVAESRCAPGDVLNFSWNVQNVGDTATGAGWTERIYIENEGGTRVYVGTTAYDGTLGMGASVSRAAQIALANYPGISGDCRAVVQIVPAVGNGETTLAQGNNTASAPAYSLAVIKHLTLTPYKGSIPENGAGRYNCELRRTGNLNVAETFSVTAQGGRVSFADGGSVTFPVGTSRVYFSVSPINNTDINIDAAVPFTVLAANGYDAVTDTLYVEDDDLIPLTLALDKEDYNEGDVMVLTGTVPARYAAGELVVSLGIEQSKRFRLPASLVFADGETTASVRIPIIDDKDPANDETVKITATAEHHSKATAMFVLHDDDVPAIALTLSPTTVSESAGPQAIYATLTRTGVTANNITVKLSDDEEGHIRYGQYKTIQMPAGTTTVNFPLGVIDNSVVDGNRTVNVTAYVYISSCNCAATGEQQAAVSVPVSIIDDDGPTLTLTVSKQTILEGDTQGATLTVSRNTADVTSPLTVSITADATDMTIPATLTIPAGSVSVSGKIVVPSNAVTEGDRTVSIIASAEGYNSGAAWLLVSDRTLPDATIERMALSSTNPLAGSQYDVALTISNIGASTLPQGVPAQVVRDGSTVATLSLAAPLAPGEKATLSTTLTASTVPGSYTHTATINPSRTVAELQYVNNTAEATLTVGSLYNFSISSDSEAYKSTQPITLSGTITPVTDAPVAGIAIEPYIVYNGARTPLPCTTDEAGRFSIRYDRPAAYRGAFAYGVCNTGEQSTAAAGTFNVYGFEQTGGYVKNDIFLGEAHNGTITLRNLSALPLHNIRPTLSGATEGYTMEVGSLSVLEGDATVDIPYTITSSAVSTGTDWERIIVTFSTDEGESIEVTTYNFTRLHTPSLALSTSSINTTVTKGQSRTYPLTITNNGKGETGAITVSLPTSMNGFVTLASAATMPSLAYGESATMMLQFNPGDLDVNIIQTGSIGVNCERGSGVSLYFNVKVVSEAEGTLRVVVRDENTYYGNAAGEHPYVKDATVKLLDYNTGALVCSGITPDESENGVTLPPVSEGYYRLVVTADKHSGYTQNILISPGEITTHVATLSYEAVNVLWEVVEDNTYQDEYEIKTTVTYETSVPMPVVRVTLPDTIAFDAVPYGGSLMFNAILRNDGLIAAKQCRLELPEVPGFELTPLVNADDFDLGANQSYTIPVRAKRIAEDITFGGPDDTSSSGSGGSGSSGGGQSEQGSKLIVKCFAKITTYWHYECYEDLIQKYISVSVVTVKDWSHCRPTGPTISTGTYAGGGVGGGLGGPSIWRGGSVSGGGSASSADNRPNILPCPTDVCDLWPCINGYIPWYECGMVGLSYSNAVKEVTQTSLSCSMRYIPTYGSLYGMIYCLGDAINCYEANNKSVPSLVRTFYNYGRLYTTYMQTFRDWCLALFDAPDMIDAATDEVAQSLDAVNARLNELEESGTLLTMQPLTEIPDNLSAGTDPYGILQLMPGGQATVLDFDVRRYAERYINTIKKASGGAVEGDNYVDAARLSSIIERRDSCNVALVSAGFADWKSLVEKANAALLDYSESLKSNTCATVQLEISQRLVMTRQTFIGTLTVTNNTSTPLTDINLDLLVENLLGEKATAHEFQINFESIEGFTGDTIGPWTLAGSSKGVATIRFIPTRYAAPDTLTTWSFGGTLTWNDGTATQSRDLLPVSLMVKPSPVLDLTYFMQRDIYGDNPLTPDVVEPVVPAEFSLLMHNKGLGDATDVRMITQQPRIVDNAKGLAATFSIVSSSLNGGTQTPALGGSVATEFGDIPAGTSTYATWYLACDVLGHFTDYNVTANHVNSYGNPNLTLLEDVTIHELIHSIKATVGDTVLRAWVVNDEDDVNDTPDRIYFSNGTNEPLSPLAEATTVERLSPTQCRVSVVAERSGWFYTNLPNPAATAAGITSVTAENTSRALDAEAFWTSRYTLRDGADPIDDNRLHIVDYVTAGGTYTYLVEFEPTPDVRLAVVAIDTLPDADALAQQPISQLTVRFNKGIDATTFTRDDITLRYEGEVIDTPLPITALTGSDSIFVVNTAALTANGYYVLAVSADSITDKEGYTGGEGMLVKWVLFKDGLVHYNVSAWPLLAGSTTVAVVASDGQAAVATATGEVAYGTSLQLTAQPAEGYTFAYWAHATEGNNQAAAGTRRLAATDDAVTAGLKQFSTQNPLTLLLDNAQDVRAVFIPRQYRVDVACDTAAAQVSIGTSYIAYGTEVNLVATARSGYRVTGIVINGNTVEGTAATFTVTGTTSVEILTEDLRPKSIILNESNDYVPADIPAASVTLKRTFSKGQWNTIVLPCAVNDPVAVFGTGTEVAEFIMAAGDVLYFERVSAMEPNVPYLIKPGLTNATLADDGTPHTAVYNIPATSLTTPQSGTPSISKDGTRFVGSYAAVSILADDDNYTLVGDRFEYVDSETSCEPFRAFIKLTEGTWQTLYINIDGQITSISGHSVTATSAPVYDVQGRLVKPAHSDQRLAPGIYVTHGRKFIVR